MTAAGKHCAVVCASWCISLMPATYGRTLSFAIFNSSAVQCGKAHTAFIYKHQLARLILSVRSLEGSSTIAPHERSGVHEGAINNVCVIHPIFLAFFLTSSSRTLVERSDGRTCRLSKRCRLTQGCAHS